MPIVLCTNPVVFTPALRFAPTLSCLKFRGLIRTLRKAFWELIWSFQATGVFFDETAFEEEIAANNTAIHMRFYILASPPFSNVLKKEICARWTMLCVKLRTM
jgi:hypothetical protein